MNCCTVLDLNLEQFVDQSNQLLGVYKLRTCKYTQEDAAAARDISITHKRQQRFRKLYAQLQLSSILTTQFVQVLHSMRQPTSKQAHGVH